MSLAGGGPLIQGVTYEVGPEAVVVQSRHTLSVLSSAVAGGGLATARSIVNLHVAKDWQPAAHGDVSGWEAALNAYVAGRGLPTPYVGLCTSAWTEHAEVAREREGGFEALVLISVGLGNPIASGLSARAVTAPPSTINTIVVLGAQASPAALVNLVATVTEVKTAVLRDAAIRAPDGHPATGTSTDAVVIAATGRGPVGEFGGPISDLGALAARAARRALERGVAAWLERHR
jgi:iron complex transport system ATP-binding protein